MYVYTHCISIYIYIKIHIGMCYAIYKSNMHISIYIYIDQHTYMYHHYVKRQHIISNIIISEAQYIRLYIALYIYMYVFYSTIPPYHTLVSAMYNTNITYIYAYCIYTLLHTP